TAATRARGPTRRPSTCASTSPATDRSAGSDASRRLLGRARVDLARHHAVAQLEERLLDQVVARARRAERERDAAGEPGEPLVALAIEEDLLPQVERVAQRAEPRERSPVERREDRAAAHRRVAIDDHREAEVLQRD